MGGREEQGKHSPGPVAFIDEPEGHPLTRASIWEHVREDRMLCGGQGVLSWNTEVQTELEGGRTSGQRGGEVTGERPKA